MTRTPSILIDLLAECDAHGVRVAAADGGGLTIDAPQDALTPDLLSRLKTHKADVLDAIEQFEERAAIMQYDGGLAREHAESLALQQILQLTRSPFNGPDANRAPAV